MITITNVVHLHDSHEDKYIDVQKFMHAFGPTSGEPANKPKLATFSLPLMSRRDGRKNNDLRNLSVNFDDLARVDGSARFGFGKSPAKCQYDHCSTPFPGPENLALASLSGPIEVRLSAENPSKATLDVHLRPLSNVSATESKSLASAIASALTPSLLLTQNPRTLVQLVVQALSLPPEAWKDGLTAAMINASTLAFLNAASIPMKGIVCAVTVGRLASSKQFIVDPSGEEAVLLDAGGCFAFLFADGLDERVKCVWTNWRSFSGGFEEKDLIQARNVASESAREVWSKMKLCVNYREQPGLKAHAEKNDGPGEDSDDDKMII